MDLLDAVANCAMDAVVMRMLFIFCLHRTGFELFKYFDYFRYRGGFLGYRGC